MAFFGCFVTYKIDPKSTQNGALGVPGDPRGLPGASRGTVRARFQTKLKINEKINDSGRLPGRPGRLPGTQRDPRNQPKIEFLLKKKAFQTSMFVDFCAQGDFACFLLDFPSLFQEILVKNDEQQKCIFS